MDEMISPNIARREFIEGTVPCRDCGRRPKGFQDDPYVGYTLYCPNCHKYTGTYLFLTEAVDAWNSECFEFIDD